MKRLEILDSFFEQKSVEEIAGWIRKGIMDFYNPKKTHFAFYPAYFSQVDCLSSSFAEMVANLEPENRNKVAKAIKIAFLESEGEKKKKKELLFFMNQFMSRNIRLDEILEDASFVEEIWNKHKGTRGLFLNILIFGNIACTKKAEILRRIIKSEYFVPEFAPLALVGLSRAEPENFLNHLELLRDHFVKLHQEKRNLKNSTLTAKILKGLIEKNKDKIKKYREYKWLLLSEP